MISNYVVFGTSEKARKLLADMFYEVDGMLEKISCFCDNDPKKWGTFFEGKEVISCHKLLELLEEDRTIEIIIASSFEAEIYMQLVNFGVGDRVFFYKTKSKLYVKEHKGYFGGVYYGSKTDRYKKREYLLGTEYCGPTELLLHFENDCIVPINTYAEGNKLTFRIDEMQYEKVMETNRFEYFKLDKNQKCEIRSDKNLIVGESINLHQEKPHKVKLNLLIICDSLSGQVLEMEGIEKLMPNTLEFFDNGIRCNQCYCGADWTLPGVATVFTGKYPMEHRMIHPREVRELSGDSMLTYPFKQDGFLTSHFGSNWRGDPEYGYAKGMDRHIYINGWDRGDVVDLLRDMKSHLRAFPDRDHFIVLNLIDLHHFLKEVQDLPEQIMSDMETHFYEGEKMEKSVYRGYDKIKTKIYCQEIKKLDDYLKELYIYLEENFKDNMNVILCADHGVTYSSMNEFALDIGEKYPWFKDSMIRVPLMIKAQNIQKEKYEKVTDNCSIKKILEAFLDYENVCNDKIKQILNINYAYNESIYPGQTYKAKVVTNEYIYSFESMKLVNDICMVDANEFTDVLMDRNSGEKVVEQSIKDYFLNIVFEHINKQNGLIEIK